MKTLKRTLKITLALLLLALMITKPETGYSQGFGIDTPLPMAKLDVNGDLAIRISAKSLLTGANHNVTVTGSSFVRITGPTNNYSISGIAGGVNGKMLILYNSTPHDLTLSHQNTLSTATNRIIASGETDDKVKKYGCATLIYSATDSRWIVISYNK